MASAASDSEGGQSEAKTLTPCVRVGVGVRHTDPEEERHHLFVTVHHGLVPGLVSRVGGQTKIPISKAVCESRVG
eukprot:scaffold57904_cov64-Phaeocystis_antarctica.AAC.1